MLIGGGIGLNIIITAFVHIGVNVGVLPVTGQPLPFVSLGGTSLILNCIQIGILQSIFNSKNGVTGKEQSPSKEL